MAGRSASLFRLVVLAVAVCQHVGGVAPPSPPSPVYGAQITYLSVHGPAVLAADAYGNLYVGETGNHRVAVQLANGSFVTWVGGNNIYVGCVSTGVLRGAWLYSFFQGTTTTPTT